MNKSDSIDISLSLEENGYERVGDEKKADVVVLNTCCVRENAEERIFGRLGYYRSLKRRNNKDIIIVLSGCMAQQKGRMVVDRFPEIGVVIGTYHGLEIPHYIESYEKEKNHILVLDKDCYKFSTYKEKRAEGCKAWVNIIKGCSNFCSYCIVPYLRGPEQSKDSREIIKEIKKLVYNGVKEVTLLGQNVNAFGKDNGDISFIALLERINKIDGIEWIRFLTSHPKDFNEKTVERISTLDKVCKQFHLPLQSGSDRVLNLMKRKYDIKHYMAIVKAIEKYIPDYSITTDLIVGFPEENDDDFRATLNLMKEVEFDDAFTYRYSERPFTSAKDIYPKVCADVSRERLKDLIKVQRNISLKKSKMEIGKNRKVLIEGHSKKNKEELLGKTEKGKMVVVKSKSSVGSFINVHINDISGNTLRGIEI